MRLAGTIIHLFIFITIQTMATQQSEAPVAPESQDVLLALNKQTKEYGYVTELNPQTGDFTWETPEGNDYRERMFRFPTNT